MKYLFKANLRGSLLPLAAIVLLVISIIAPHTCQAQKHTLPYQTILADKQGDPLKDVEVEVLVELKGYSASGTTLYSETHTQTTGLAGEVSFLIGSGAAQSIKFIELDWSIPIYVDIQFKPLGFINYFSNNTSELLSVPYAVFSLYSKCEEGCPGEPGAKGAKGAKGAQGASGPQSPPAATGRPGDQGAKGVNGVFEFTMRSEEPWQGTQNEVYLDDGTNRTDNNPGLRIFLNNNWQDL